MHKENHRRPRTVFRSLFVHGRDRALRNKKPVRVHDNSWRAWFYVLEIRMKRRESIARCRAVVVSPARL